MIPTGEALAGVGCDWPSSLRARCGSWPQLAVPPSLVAVLSPARLPACSVPDAALAKQLGLNEGLLQGLMELPGTKSMLDLKTRLVALAEWNSALRK